MATIDKSPTKIHKMFNKIAQKYDFINNIISFGTQNLIKFLCVKRLNLKPNDNVIDLCCGTGDLTNFARRIQPKANVIGVDFSEKMLEIAKNKNPNIEFFQADVTNLPYEDNFFDVVMMGFGLRNIQDFEKAMLEVSRVLKPNGKFLHIDFGKKSMLSKLYDRIISILIPVFTTNTEAYSYFIKSRQTFPEPDDLINEFKKFEFTLDEKINFFGVISAQLMRRN